MKLGEFKGLSRETAKFQCIDKGGFSVSSMKTKEDVSLSIERGYLYLSQGDIILKVKPEEGVEGLDLRINRGLSKWVLNSVKNNNLVLRYVEFVDHPLLIDLDIGVAPKEVEGLFERGEISTNDMGSAIDWFNEEFLLLESVFSCLIMSVYAASSGGSLEIRGKDWVATVSEVSGYWSVSKLSRSRRASTSLKLLQGNIRFSDTSVATQLSEGSHKFALSESIKNQGSYIQLWNQYSDMEWQLKLKDAVRIGELRFTEINKSSKERIWEFTAKPHAIERFKNELSRTSEDKNDDLLAADYQVIKEAPDWLDNSTELSDSGLVEDNSGLWVCKVVGFENNKIILELQSERDEHPPFIKDKNNIDLRKGTICLSMNGYQKIRERRLSAINSIQQKSNPMPQLHYLLEGVDIPADTHKKIEPLSNAARENFKGEPTPKQKEALRIALNTPDIAIIVGPPGTGKTQVITALQTRLSEELGDEPLQHQMLITSYQHDAVDNVIARSGVFGLPAVKVGGRSVTKETTDDPIDLWCKNKAVEVNQYIIDKVNEHPELTRIKIVLRELASLQASVGLDSSRQEKINEIDRELKKLQNDISLYLSPETQGIWTAWVNGYNSALPKKSQISNAFPLSVIRALRTSIPTFNDDGSKQCIRLLDSLRRFKIALLPDQYQLIECLTSIDEPTDEQLTALSKIKDTLLDSMIPDYRPTQVKKSLSEEECQLLENTRACLLKYIKESKTFGYLSVLDEYHVALKNSPQEIRRAVEEYTSVLGATCQQSAGNPMVSIKNVPGQSLISFNAVIVDEAARANPLDLLVPMSMGRRRIVLVGDHRQLPHLLEPKVEDELAEKYELGTVHEEMFKKSLFERLKISLEALERENGQPKRVVMLDTQFRMHPKLGSFISENFYESHELAKVKSGLPEENFGHSISGFGGKVAAWIRVPENSGKSARRDGSLYRNVEADIVAKRAKEILSENPELSVGIITFYRSQVESIKDAMKPLGLVEATSNGLSIAPEWQFTTGNTGAKKERLRVGTVDAFQGMEFDVVLLSTVRTLKPGSKMTDEDSLNRSFGFLRLDNRLNVAMSRQQRLLILVGDPVLATHASSTEAVPSLNAFYQLCKEDHGVII